jgi:ADP-heptose:LPS heptosyltransferase
MFRSPSDAPKTNINITFYGGGMGDCIAKMPAVRYLLREYKHVTADMWVPDYFMELAEYWLKDEPHIRKLRPFSAMKAECDFTLPALLTHNSTATTIHTHLVHNAYNTLLDIPAPEDPTDLEYYRITGEPDQNYGNYVVITTNFTANSREMKPETINALIDWADSKSLKVVFLGKSIMDLGEQKHTHILAKTSRAELHRGINLINQTSLLEAARIMSKAKAVIGLDNGLLHLAACTDVPIVGGFSTVDPNTRMPYRQGRMGHNFYPVVPDESLGCRFCQTNMNLVYKVDFRLCYYSDYKCLDLLDKRKYIDALERLDI